MENKSENILDSLTFANGKEEVVAPKKKATKKSVKKTKYSYEELRKKKPYQLESICKELGILVEKFDKVKIIKDILDKN